MNSYPLVTIVTPTYNSEKFLEKTILSVINQSYKNIEYIIIDGNSDDGTIKIVKKYRKKISYIIKENDEGMYDAIKKGFSRGKGKYFFWVNSDDLLFKNAIKDAVNIMEIKNYKWIVGQAHVMGSNNRILNRGLYHYPNWIIKNGLANPCFWGFIPQESVIFTSKLYHSVGGIQTRYKLAGDFDLWKRFSQKTNLRSVNIKIGIFRKRQGQLSEDIKKYFEEINKKNCLIPFGKILRLIYSLSINLIKNS